jgi:hypothetical protein
MHQVTERLFSRAFSPNQLLLASWGASSASALYSYPSATHIGNTEQVGLAAVNLTLKEVRQK